MSNTYVLDPNFSIIYHNPDVVEFRSGVWNVISHVLEDSAHQENLAKLIHHLEQNPGFLVSDLVHCAGISKSDCHEIFETLRKKKIVIENQEVHQIKQLQNHIEPEVTDELLFKKVKIIAPPDIALLIQNILAKQFPKLEVLTVLERDISFMIEAGENLFSDSLLLEKTVTQCQHLFENSFVLTVTDLVNPLFFSYLNKVFYAAEINWFFGAIDGPFIYIGPLFTNLFCFECLENRILMATKRYSEYIDFKKSILLKSIKFGCPSVDESYKHLLCSLICIELSTYLRMGRTITTHKALSIYLPTREFAYHKILRLPGCRVCGVDNALEGHQLHFDTGALLEL